MATILISHCERNLGRVEKHVGRGGELGEWGVSPSEPPTVSLLSQDGGHLAVIFSWFHLFLYRAFLLSSIFYSLVFMMFS